MGWIILTNKKIIKTLKTKDELNTNQTNIYKHSNLKTKEKLTKRKKKYKHSNQKMNDKLNKPN